MNYLILLLSLCSLSVHSATKDDYSKERWMSWGSFGAIVLATEIHNGKSDYYGLIVECSPSKGQLRISVKDVYSKPGDKIQWETDTKMGSIVNQASMVIRTSEKDTRVNNTIVSAMKAGSWIKFENMARGSSATYTLKGSTKAISSITSCK